MNASKKSDDVAREKNYTPLLVLGGLLMLIAGVSFLPASWFGAKPVVRKYEPLNLTSLGIIDQTAQDTDNDGLVSWKEFVAGSLDIPTSQTSDQETVKDITSDPRTIAALNDPNNLTSSFSKNLYIASTVLQKNGIVDPTNEQEVINQILKEEVTKLQPVTYTESDIKVGKEDSAVALKTYGNTVATILQSAISEKSMIEDLSSLSIFSESGDEADLAPIFINKRKTGEALEKLLAVSVPKSAVSLHLIILNSVGTYANTLKDLSAAFDDPMRATLALKHYMQDAGLVINNFPKLSDFFKSRNITFSAREAGYVFMVGYTGK